MGWEWGQVLALLLEDPKPRDSSRGSSLGTMLMLLLTQRGHAWNSALLDVRPWRCGYAGRHLYNLALLLGLAQAGHGRTAFSLWPEEGKEEAAGETPPSFLSVPLLCTPALLSFSPAVVHGAELQFL